MSNVWLAPPGRLDPGAHPILAAGLDAPAAADDPESADDHPHSELAWRLRHLKRSVLKDSGEVVAIDESPSDATLPEAPSSILGGAFASAASFFTDPLFSGEVNLLTTSAIASGQQLTTGDLLPRGVAYVSIGAPVAGGQWAVRGSMSQSELSSWILAGSFSSRDAGSHDYGFGVSDSTQQYQARTVRPLALDGSTARAGGR